MAEKITVGNLEICALPDLGISDLEVRIDTGAKTSSLHVDNIKRFTEAGKPWVSFDLHPDAYQVEQVIRCKSRLHDIRSIKSSNGVSEERYVIKTGFQIGDNVWPIEITLTNRADMNYLMLLGRQGMGKRILVDPSQTFMVDSKA